MKDSILWRCNFCGGLAHWCFINDEAYYHCHAECGLFMQEGLFESVFAGKIVRHGSVSALTGGQAEYEKLVGRIDPRPEDRVPF